jgi:hypothetical protein
MSLNEKINKIKITLFGNVWAARLIKLLRYVGGALLAWLIWKSEYMLGKETPAQIFRSYIRDWSTKNVDILLSVALTIGYFLALLLVYFYLSGKLIKWLTRIEIPASQQDQIFQNKIYSADEKTHYSVEKIINLEINGYRGSSYVDLKGNLSLSLQKTSQKRQANCFCPPLS